MDSGGFKTHNFQQNLHIRFTQERENSSVFVISYFLPFSRFLKSEKLVFTQTCTCFWNLGIFSSSEKFHFIYLCGVLYRAACGFVLCTFSNVGKASNIGRCPIHLKTTPRVRSYCSSISFACRSACKNHCHQCQKKLLRLCIIHVYKHF